MLPQPSRVVNVEATNVFYRNREAKAQTIVNKGGSGSSKSYSICQHLIFDKLFNKNLQGYKCLILRKTRVSLRKSTYKQFFEILDGAGIYDESCHSKTDMEYKTAAGSFVAFCGMDNRERIKSTEWHDIWLEEGNEFCKEDYTFLKTRLYRGELNTNAEPRIIISYNPVACWIQGIEGHDNVEVIHSTYKDNPKCNQAYKDTLEGLKDEDPAYYKIYALGETAEAKNIIYEPYIRVDKLPEHFDEIIYGLDFGFNKPTALIMIGIKDGLLYLKELIYRTQLTNPEKIALMKEVIPERRRCKQIFADSEDPNAIEEIKQAGFNVIPADKKAGSVKAGIDFCRRKKFYTVEENINLNKEREGYKWKEDKDGNILDEQVKFRDHALDAKRYAVHGYFVGLGEVDSLKEALKQHGRDSNAGNSISSRADW